MEAVNGTSSAQVVAHFARSSAAKQALARWERQRPEVARHVMNHVTRVPYAVSLADLYRTAEETEHSLGDIAKKDIAHVTEIRDWSPRFAMTHVMHYALEGMGGPFTFQGFRQFCQQNEQAREMLWSPAQEMIAKMSPRVGHTTAHDAMQWRIGIAYYSFLRELIVVAGLREHGLDVLIHPLADALFRVDAWLGTDVIALYIGNAKFRKGRQGRKPLTQRLLGPEFNCISIQLPNSHDYGSLWVPGEEELAKASETLAQSIGGQPGGA